VRLRDKSSGKDRETRGSSYCRFIARFVLLDMPRINIIIPAMNFSVIYRSRVRRSFDYGYECSRRSVSDNFAVILCWLEIYEILHAVISTNCNRTLQVLNYLKRHIIRSNNICQKAAKFFNSTLLSRAR